MKWFESIVNLYAKSLQLDNKSSPELLKIISYVIINHKEFIWENNTFIFIHFELNYDLRYGWMGC